LSDVGGRSLEELQWGGGERWRSEEDATGGSDEDMRRRDETELMLAERMLAERDWHGAS